MRIAVFTGTVLLLMAGSAGAAHPWDEVALGPDKRADLVLEQMGDDDKLRLVFGQFGSVKDGYEPPAEAIMGSAGFVAGVPRLGIPPLWETDAGLGVATQGSTRDRVRERTSLPSGIATAATWNPDLAFRGGAMIGTEARDSGFNVMLAGGVNLMREPRNGRNFEYAGEDPLLAGLMVGSEIAGIESNHIISTIKHFAVNDQETARQNIDAVIDWDQARMSDLLAFQLAIELGRPGAVMCSYNRVNGDYACENARLLTGLLRKDWGYKGFVMSDWGAVHSLEKSVASGLDQESGSQFDDRLYFGEPLRQALRQGRVSRARLDEMARHVLYAMFAHGVVDYPLAIGRFDVGVHGEVSREDAEEGMVLLKNVGEILPLPANIKRLAVIGGHADVGVLAGGGSSLVYPVGGNAVPGLNPTSWPGPVMVHPSSPLRALQARLPRADLRFADGGDQDAAVKLAADSEAVVLFVDQWTGEAHDARLELRNGQDDLVAAVAAANPHTIVVVESGGPILMPWAGKVAAVLEAWYAGTSGGDAIARVLLGEVDPSGRLPATFPQSVDQLPHPAIEGPDKVVYDEGATVGYKWFDAHALAPAFPFGWGLSYTSFAHDGLAASIKGGKVTVSFIIRNTGERKGKDVPQIYVGPRSGGWEAPRRLAGWRKVELAPGESQTVTLAIDPRLLAVFRQGSWHIAAGEYIVWLGRSSRDLESSVNVTLKSQSFR
jgi:beta-glucosidase